MKTDKSRYFKAALLLLVFSLNTVVSFACSFTGLFHNLHHAAQHKASVAAAQHQHHHESAHEHVDAHHDHEDGNSSGTKDDCCSKSVVELDKVEKALSKSISAPEVVFVNNVLSAFTSLLAPAITLDSHAADQFRWRLAATIPDRRIVIQSFQI